MIPNHTPAPKATQPEQGHANEARIDAAVEAAYILDAVRR